MELKNGKKIPVVNAVVRSGPEFQGERMPVAQGKLSDQDVTILPDTGCSIIIVRMDSVRKDEFTGETNPVYFKDGPNQGGDSLLQLKHNHLLYGEVPV